MDNFELPRISEVIAQLRDVRCYTVIDLKDAYFHVPIEENDKQKTAFYTGRRIMHFRMMPQGYKNSPAIFQRIKNIIFAEKLGNGVLVYNDDILVYGKTNEEHDINLNFVLKKN
jgi:hypothetical protein